MIRRQHVWMTLMLTGTLAWLSDTRGAAQVHGTLTDQDRAEIHALSVTYRRALFGCSPEEYADLFATPGGYFGSSSRGEVRERQALVEMILSYDRCYTKQATPAEQPATNANAKPPVIEWAPEGAKARILNGPGGGYYDDVYVKTPKGWRFKSRNVVSDAEVAAGLTTKDFIEIRQLAGDDHGHYENLYGDEKDIGPRGLSSHSNRKFFRTSGLKLTPSKDGVRGLAYLRDNGGRYEDLYVKTPEGWRIQERVYVPPAAVK